MLWLLKLLLLTLKTKRGRELLFAGGTGAVEIARSKRARELYVRAWEVAADPRPRQKVSGLARNTAAKLTGTHSGSSPSGPSARD